MAIMLSTMMLDDDDNDDALATMMGYGMMMGIQ